MVAKHVVDTAVDRRAVPEDAVAAVFARAAQLDVALAPGTAPVALDEEALVEIGASVGLSPEAVRRAVAEHHAGGLVAPANAPATWVGPRVAVAERRIDGDADADGVRRTVERDLDRQWFRKVRDQGERSVWCARTDLPARVARSVDFRHRLVLKGVSGLVLTTVDRAGAGVSVRLEANPAERRSELAWMVALATAAGATVGPVLALVGGTDLDVMALSALPTAGIGGGTGLGLVRRSYQSQLTRLTEELEGMLDRAGRGR